MSKGPMSLRRAIPAPPFIFMRSTNSRRLSDEARMESDCYRLRIRRAFVPKCVGTASIVEEINRRTDAPLQRDREQCVSCPKGCLATASN
jgi:hypothetical protein